VNAATLLAVADPSTEVGSVTPRAHLFVALAAVGVLAFIVRLVRRHGLRTKYSLLWITVGAALATLAVFPDLLTVVSELLGIYYPPATLLLLAVGFLFLVVVHFSWEMSRSEERVRVLAEELALLRERTERTNDTEPAAHTGPAGHTEPAVHTESADPTE